MDPDFKPDRLAHRLVRSKSLVTKLCIPDRYYHLAISHGRIRRAGDCIIDHKLANTAGSNRESSGIVAV